ncbi:MAG: hypothetical protein LBR91_00950 [Puniceicoccales bacterium]|jgi:hypothetical protein|nr:hypothetical protein [Puniceicoccales bacterium]
MCDAINDVRIEVISGAADSFISELPPEVSRSADGDTISKFVKKLSVVVSAARLQGNTLVLEVGSVKTKRALSSRGTVALSAANKLEVVASIVSLGEGIFKLFTADKASAMPYISAGIVGLFNFAKEKIVDLMKS